MKFIRESEDILAQSGVKSLGKFNHVCAILLLLENFNRKILKNFVEPLKFTSQLSKWKVPCDYATNLAPS